MRRKHKPWAQDALNDHPDIVIHKAEEYKGKLQKRFEKEQPIHIEIGSGKGQFIVELAKKHPDWNFIAVENQTSIIVSILQKILEEDLSNIQLLNINARDLNQIFEKHSVDQIYLNFSDPWPKTRHEKRRLTYKDFLDLYRDILKPNHSLIFKTDNKGLFEYSLKSFSVYGTKLIDVSVDLHSENRPENVQTEYEERFSQKGNAIYLAEIIFEP